MHSSKNFLRMICINLQTFYCSDTDNRPHWAILTIPIFSNTYLFRFSLPVPQHIYKRGYNVLTRYAQINILSFNYLSTVFPYFPLIYLISSGFSIHVCQLPAQIT